jgi:hypothetical protein
MLNVISGGTVAFKNINLTGIFSNSNHFLLVIKKFAALRYILSGLQFVSSEHANLNISLNNILNNIFHLVLKLILDSSCSTQIQILL